MTYLEMKVTGVAFDSLVKMPVAVLKEREGEMSVPLYLAPLEGVALVTALLASELSAPEPRKDLLQILIAAEGIRLLRVQIEEIRGRESVAAAIFLRSAGEEFSLPVATFDALAAALRYGVPVMVEEESARIAMLSDQGDGRLRVEDPERYTEYLEGLDPSDLGKYPM